MGKASRDKGRRGQQQFSALLKDRDWSVAELNNGHSVEDFIVISPSGKSYAAEVKNTVAITKAHKDQAMAQAKARNLPWLLGSKIDGTSCFLIQRQGEEPVVWCQKKE